MNSHLPSLQDLQDRLLNLEKENRRLKQLGAVVLAVAALIVAMGQAPSKKTVEANELILRDDSGNIRARLFMTTGGTTKMTVPGIAEPVPVTFAPAPTLAFYDAKGQSKALLDGTDIVFYNSQGHAGVDLGYTGVGILSVLSEDGSSGAVLVPGQVGVFDGQGFSATLGVQGSLVNPRTGETHKTTAASLVLFDKAKNVIWKAP